MTDRPTTYVGLDVSGSLVRCVVGVGEADGLEFLACGSMPQLRWDDEEDRSTDFTPEAVHEVVREVEREAGLTVVSAVVGITGPHIHARLVRSSIELQPGPRRVTLEDVRDVLEKAEQGVRGAASTALQLVPLEFAAGGRVGVSSPVGLPAARLEAYTRVVETDRRSFIHVNNTVKRAGIRVDECILAGFGAAYATLEPPEHPETVAHLDFGGSASTLTAYVGGNLRLACGIPIGWEDLVRDVGATFGTDEAVASSLIAQLGRVDYDPGTAPLTIFVPGPDPKDPVGTGAVRSLSLLTKVITRRIDDCFEYVRFELREAGLGLNDVYGLVLTGDIAGLPGIASAATTATHIKSRVGIPTRLRDLPVALQNPGWACAVGLVLYAHRLMCESDEGPAASDTWEGRGRVAEERVL
ncbi:MAG: hypothetical protein OXN89_24645 [Bryobacterales bacterium]|nr:hypothetical protein [Bryobacterales bacterium]